MNEKLAEIFYDGGISSAQELANAEVAELVELSGFGEDEVQILKDEAGISLRAAEPQEAGLEGNLDQMMDSKL